MRRSRAVTGEAAPPLSGTAARAADAEQPAAAGGAFDGTIHLLHGGEAASQVAADLAKQAQARGFKPVLLPMDQFKTLDVETCVAL